MGQRWTFCVGDSVRKYPEAYQMVLPPTFAPITQDDAYHVTPFTTVLWSSVESELTSNTQTTCQSVMANQQKREQLIAAMKQAVSRVVSHPS